MNHKKVKKQINKINAFFDSITADEDISKIEKDLLLSYVRKLYESILDSVDSAPSKSKKVEKSAPAKKQVKEVHTPVVQHIVEEPAAVETVVERKPFERAEAPTPVSKVEVPTAAVETEVVAEVTAPVIEATPAPTPVKASPTIELSENMEMIFTQNTGSDLSDRLSNMPIKDLTKSMGINERMFTIKELFGGDIDKFNTVLSDLNGLANFEEAKSYLIDGVATDLNWDDASTYKKAFNFVKLVQRRYS